MHVRLCKTLKLKILDQPIFKTIFLFCPYCPVKECFPKKVADVLPLGYFLVTFQLAEKRTENLKALH